MTMENEKNNQKKISKKYGHRRCKKRRVQKWRDETENLNRIVRSKMSISEVLDLSAMIKIVENRCNERIHEHFKYLEFKYLDPLEIEVNGEEITVFNIISFLEWLGTFEISFHSAEFIDFPSDGLLRKALFENVERISKRPVYFQAYNDTIDINYKALNMIWCENPSCRDFHQIVEKAFPPCSNIKQLNLSLCSADRCKFPKDLVKNLLTVINPTILRLFFNSATKPGDHLPNNNSDLFSFGTDPLKLISNENLRSMEMYIDCTQNSCLLVNSGSIDNLQLSCFVFKI